MDYKKCKFAFFPSGINNPWAFLPIDNKYSKSMIINIPSDVIPILKKSINKSVFKPGEIVPWIFLENQLSLKLLNSFFYSDIETAVIELNSPIWFFGDLDVLIEIHNVLIGKYPDIKKYFHEESSEDRLCLIEVGKKNCHVVKKINPEEMICFS